MREERKGGTWWREKWEERGEKARDLREEEKERREGEEEEEERIESRGLAEEEEEEAKNREEATVPRDEVIGLGCDWDCEGEEIGGAFSSSVSSAI